MFLRSKILIPLSCKCIEKITVYDQVEFRGSVLGKKIKRKPDSPVNTKIKHAIKCNIDH